MKRKRFTTQYLGKPLPKEEIDLCPKCKRTGLTIRGEPCRKCYGTGHWRKEKGERRMIWNY